MPLLIPLLPRVPLLINALTSLVLLLLCRFARNAITRPLLPTARAMALLCADRAMPPFTPTKTVPHMSAGLSLALWHSVPSLSRARRPRRRLNLQNLPRRQNRQRLLRSSRAVAQQARP